MFKQIAYTTIVRLIAGVLNLVVAIILSNYIGAEGKGLQSLILSTVTIFVFLSGVIGYGGLTYLLPRYSFSNLIFPSVIWNVISVVLMAFVVLFFNLIPSEFVWHVSILALINSLNQIHNAILQAQKRIKEINHIAMVQIVLLIGFISVFMIGFNVRSIDVYLRALYISFIASLVLGISFTSKYYKSFFKTLNIGNSLKLIRKHIVHGGANQFDIIFQLLIFRFAYYYMNSLLGTEEVGVYSNGVSLIEAIWILGRSIAYVQHSQIVNIKVNKEAVLLSLKFIKLSGVLSFVAVAVLVLMPSQVYIYVFGEEFTEVKNVILSLSLGVIFYSVSFIISSHFSGIGKHYLNMITSIAGLMIVIVLTIILIPTYGIIGAGISVTITLILVTILKLILFVNKSQIKLSDFGVKSSEIQEVKRSFRELFF